MKFTINILILIILSSCLSPIRNVEEEEETTHLEELNTLPKINSRIIEDLSLIDETKFLVNCQDSLLDMNYNDLNKLPEIEGIRHFKSQEGKYYCNRTFSSHFETYILFLYEGGECSSKLALVNVRKDTLLAIKTLWVNYWWEGEEATTRTIFENDSVFTVVRKGFSNREVKDSITYYNLQETYKIAVNGGFTLLKKSKKTWNESIKN